MLDNSVCMLKYYITMIGDYTIIIRSLIYYKNNVMFLYVIHVIVHSLFVGSLLESYKENIKTKNELIQMKE